MVDITNLSDAAQRIYKIYNSSSAQEKEYLHKMLEEIAMYGYSDTYSNVWLSDYKEIPVDIETFLSSEEYLGMATREGEAIYPYWWNVFHDIFDNGNKYEECIFTGATRIGKTSTAINCVAYMLYRLMCLRDPQAYFHKKDVSKFSILFFNITKDLASGVAYREFNDTLKSSPWFREHGSFSKSEQNFYYIPEGDKISIDFGSDASHGLGKQVFCLVGDTNILTKDGYKPLKQLVYQTIDVAQFGDNDISYSPAKVVLTKYTGHTIELYIRDGSKIEGTPEHPILLANGEYKPLGELVLGDRLFSLYNLYEHNEIIAIIHHKRFVPVYDVINVIPHHNFIVQGRTHDFVVHNCAVLDEVNFSKAGVKDINKAKQHIMDTYNTISARIKGTFRMHGEVYGKLFAVSSKNSDSDFIEEHVQKQMSSGAGDHMYVSDKPQWEVLPPRMFKDEKFYIAVGDRYKKGFVIPDNQTDEVALEELKSQGYLILNPPIDMRPEFIADFDIALRDLAGISVPGAMSFISQQIIDMCINRDRRCPFYQDILQMGTMDNLTLEEFFHIEHISQYLKFPTFIHLDLSKNTDRTGISGIAVTGRKDIQTLDGKTISQPTFTHLFSVAIEATRGDRIPYAKITAFICWLRLRGLNIFKISRDQFQSEYMAQLLEAQGFEVNSISLDRTPDGYTGMKSILLEQRIDMLDHKLLQDELIHLQRDSVTGKVDHPVFGCFTGDTKIRLVDGRSLTIEELLLEQKYRTNWVYTVNVDKKIIEPKRIKDVFQTKLVTDILEVELDNGEKIHCTPEHRFMLRDGTYKEAQNLSVGESLMPLYTRVQERGLIGYRTVYQPFNNKWVYEHRAFCPNNLHKKNYVVHHCNYKKLDNCPSNLKYMSKSNHARIHNNSTMDYSKTSKSLKNYYARIHNTDIEVERSKRISEAVIAACKRLGTYKNLKQVKKDHITDIERTYNISWDSLSTYEKNSYAIRYYRLHNPEAYDEVSTNLSKAHSKGLFENAHKAISNRIWYTDGVNNVYIKNDEMPPNGYRRGRTFSNEARRKLQEGIMNMSEETKRRLKEKQSKYTSNLMWITNGYEDRYVSKDTTIEDGWVRGRSQYKRNHKVVSITKIHLPCRVYDLTIEDNPNFALDAGVFVHNSKDLSDSFAGALWNATLSNPGITLGAKSTAGIIAAINGGRNNNRYSGSKPSTKRGGFPII